MSIAFIAGILVTLAFAASLGVHLKRCEKHDRILFRFCQLRRDLMARLRERANSMPQRELESADFLLNALSGVIRHYHGGKTTMFNVRKMRRLIDRNLDHYHAVEREVRARLADTSADIRPFYEEFSRSLLAAFVAYTPFIRTEIVFRLIFQLLWGDIAGQIAAIRREAADKLRDEKFA